MKRFRCVFLAMVALVLSISVSLRYYTSNDISEKLKGDDERKVLPTQAELMTLSRKEVSQLYHEISFDFSFDDDVANKYGCEVHSYDPSMRGVSDHLRGKRVHFHKTGLNDSDTVNANGWRMRTFSSILKENNHTKQTIDVLKIDIECSELWALPEMLTSGSLRNVKQLCFEMHIKRSFQSEPDKKKYIYGLSIFRDLYNEGFRIFKSHKNMYPAYVSIYGMERTGCHEVYMIQNFEVN